MITTLQNNKFVSLVNRFINSIYYLILVAVIILVCNIFGLEFIGVCLLAIFAVWSLLFSSNLLACFPLALFGFMIVSNVNSDTTHNISLLSNKAFAITFLVCGSLVGLLILVRVVFDIFRKKDQLKVPAMSIGIGALFLAIIMGGLFSPYKSSQEILFAFVLAICFAAPYFFFYLCVDWNEEAKDFVFYSLLVMGILISLEVFYKAIDLKWIHPITEYTIDGDFIKLGWGVKPEIGTTLAMSIPSFFYFIHRKKKKYIYLLLLLIVMVALVLLRARWPFAFGLITFIVLFIYTFIKSNKKDRIINGSIMGGVLLISVIMMIIFNKQVYEFFKTTIEQFTTHRDSDEERLRLYRVGLEQFVQYPVFGVGWYQCPSNVPYSYNGNIIPPRYHDTFIQFLACTGSIGVLAYLYHRFETVKYFIKNRSFNKMIIGLSILMLLLGSLLDTHLFNLACTIQYSMLLVVLEKIPSDQVSA